ncbi:hypothetical protein LPJ70_000942 [Coemansia sp. RSA 2708]|nr:hypothetical protein LPJ70_000942 [Coemansia sp. RSA 2708]
MAHRDHGLTPISMPPSLEHANAVPASARSGGLLGKMFRKGPPKHPKLNPVGISSKDYFASAPMSAPARPDPATPLAAPKGAKLARKLSALTPPTAQAASPLTLTPRSAAVSAFPAAAHECLSDGDVDTMLSTPPATADQLRHPRRQPLHAAGSDPDVPGVAPPRRRRPSRLKLGTPESVPSSDAKGEPANNGEAALPGGDRKRRGSLWRAKLSFTNIRRPETRRQRHQSFDSNAVDIAAHPRMFSESPLVSLPAAAPVTAHGRNSVDSGQLLADALLEAGIDIAGPHSAAPATTHGGLAGSPGVAPDDIGGLGAIDRDFLLTIQRNSALEARRQRRRETRRSTMSFLAPSDARRAAPASTAVAARSPKKPRPTSLDSLTFADTPGNSSRSARSSVDELLLSASASPQRVALSEISEAAVKESISRAALAASAAEPAMSAAPLARAGADTTVPPVPPLPTHIVPQTRKSPPVSEPPRPPDIARPGTARARDSPRVVTDSRKCRGSTSIVPPALHLGEKAPPPSLNMALLLSTSTGADAGGWDAQAARMQRYRMAPATSCPQSAVSAGAAPKLELVETSPMMIPELAHDHSPATAVYGRKFSHPDAQLQNTSPSSVPDVLSKSAINLNTRMSVDSRVAPRDANTSISHAKHGLSRLFSPSPPARKAPPADASEVSQPTSPTIASLVGDPSARRRIRDQLASSRAFDRLLEEDDEFTMAISLTPTVAGHK